VVIDHGNPIGPAAGQKVHRASFEGNREVELPVHIPS
jgi:hypothetical protein